MVQTNDCTKKQRRMRRNTEQYNVPKGSAEYESIESYLYKTIGKNRSSTSIVKIERITNQALLDQYVGKLETMKTRDIENPHHRINNHNKHCMQTSSNDVPSSPEPEIERRWLFHGTRAEAIPKIIKQGFNRSFARQDAVKYGRGVYFACDAFYSCEKRFAVPDQDGVQHVFLCRVAVGDWCLGTDNQVTPHCKPHDDREVFDSTVDNIQNPNIFVIYHDCQAYPEYLVSFRTATS
jgi:poly [ADP-ribose] polymerase 10/14/15